MLRVSQVMEAAQRRPSMVPRPLVPNFSNEKGEEKMVSKFKAWRNAVKDAKNNIPGRDDPNFAQFEQELMAKARGKAR